jgi:hypothetical protein
MFDQAPQIKTLAREHTRGDEVEMSFVVGTSCELQASSHLRSLFVLLGPNLRSSNKDSIGWRLIPAAIVMLEHDLMTTHLVTTLGRRGDLASQVHSPAPLPSTNCQEQEPDSQRHSPSTFP